MQSFKSPSTRLLGNIVLGALFVFQPLNAAKAEDTVKVFILAGQSNMEGHGVITADPARNEGKGSLEHAARKDLGNAEIGQWLASDGSWKERSDVWIHYLNRHGKLRPGFGVNEDRIGPELGFGAVMGTQYQEPVLLIKLAWGGKSLAKDFRPPSAVGGQTGDYYQLVIRDTQKVLANFKTLFPELSGKQLELIGFGWHQGWNDRVNQSFNDAYQENMTHFIHDIRRDLQHPSLPFVIAETGMSGYEEKHPRAVSLMAAQKAVADQEEFKGNVAFVETKPFYRSADQSPSGQAYHWNTNAETYYLIGQAMAEALNKLQSK
ncbi:sialate O-acetylesterase [bacterium]|nr:sialate O-acetylesterase [bacterium]